MTSIMGGKWRIEIGDGQATEEFDPIGGETGFEWSRSSKEQDLSSKDDGEWDSYGYSRRSVSIRVNGKVKLPDAGLERADAVTRSTSRKATIRIVVIETEVVKFQGLCGLSEISGSFPDDAPATYNFSCKSSGAPTVDNLGATS